MANDTIRREFERTRSRDKRRSPRVGEDYTDPATQSDWIAFQKGWMQSYALHTPATQTLIRSMWDDHSIRARMSGDQIRLMSVILSMDPVKAMEAVVGAQNNSFFAVMEDSIKLHAHLMYDAPPALTKTVTRKDSDE